MRSSSGRPGRLVLLRDRHHEPQVRLHERALRVVAQAGGAPQLALLRGRERLATAEQLLARRVALLDLLREADLVVLGEQRVLADVGEIEPDEIFFVALDTLLRHPVTPWLVDTRRADLGRPRTRARACSPRMLLLLPVHDTGRVKRHRQWAVARVRAGSAPRANEVVALLGVEVEVVEHEVEHPHDRAARRSASTRPTTPR